MLALWLPALRGRLTRLTRSLTRACASWLAYGNDARLPHSDSTFFQVCPRVDVTARTVSSEPAALAAPRVLLYARKRRVRAVPVV